MFEKILGNEPSRGQANKQTQNGKRETDGVTDYYHQALQGKEQEVKLLKHRINQFLEEQTRSKKAFSKLEGEYQKYREDSSKLMNTEYDKMYKAYELEKKKNLLLEEKVRVLEATIEHLRGAR